MKFNYLKVAKQNGISKTAFRYAEYQKNVLGDRRYMAALWLAWAYRFQFLGDKKSVTRNLKQFLIELAIICRTKNLV